jgi:probable rRNA maturation factor
MAAAISFVTEEIKFVLKNKTKHKAWLAQVAAAEKFKIDELNYIFCSDEYLHRINLEYLEHDTYTDIITFDNSEDPASKQIEGDIFISIDRVKDNAVKYGVETEVELHRVMAHGLLHLMGYKDKSKKQSETMRSKEEDAIRLFDTMA